MERMDDRCGSDMLHALCVVNSVLPAVPRMYPARPLPPPTPLSPHTHTNTPPTPCAADANILINTCRLQAQRYLLTYQEPIPVEQLVRGLCDTKQGYTQFGGLRPFGVSLLYAGW